MTDYLTYKLIYTGRSYDMFDRTADLEDFIKNSSIPAVLIYDKHHPTHITAGLLTDDHMDVFENAVDFLGYRIDSRIRGTLTATRTP